jgi:hypothetical protein
VAALRLEVEQDGLDVDRRGGRGRRGAGGRRRRGAGRGPRGGRGRRAAGAGAAAGAAALWPVIFDQIFPKMLM